MSDEAPTIFRVSGDVDFLERDSLHASLVNLANARAVILDFTDANYIDSTGISQLLLFARDRRRAGASVPRIVAGAGVARLFEIAGVAALVPVFSTLDEALEA